jgi:hypothetical protein
VGDDRQQKAIERPLSQDFGILVLQVSGILAEETVWIRVGALVYARKSPYPSRTMSVASPIASPKPFSNFLSFSSPDV